MAARAGHGPSGATGKRGESAVRYEFLLPGQLSEAVRSAFPELTAAASPTGGTVLYGPVKDSSHLHGLLDRFQNFGLTVVELRQLPD